MALSTRAKLAVAAGAVAELTLKRELKRIQPENKWDREGTLLYKSKHRAQENSKEKREKPGEMQVLHFSTKLKTRGGRLSTHTRRRPTDGEKADQGGVWALTTKNDDFFLQTFNGKEQKNCINLVVFSWCSSSAARYLIHSLTHYYAARQGVR